MMNDEAEQFVGEPVVLLYPNSEEGLHYVGILRRYKKSKFIPFYVEIDPRIYGAKRQKVELNDALYAITR